MNESKRAHVNAKTIDLDQQTVCGAPAHWLKYTTEIVSALVLFQEQKCWSAGPTMG